VEPSGSFVKDVLCVVLVMGKSDTVLRNVGGGN